MHLRDEKTNEIYEKIDKLRTAQKSAVGRRKIIFCLQLGWKFVGSYFNQIYWAKNQTWLLTFRWPWISQSQCLHGSKGYLGNLIDENW